MSESSGSDGRPPDRRILAVSSMPLVDGIGLTLVRDASGWRFYGWHTHDGLAVHPDASAADRALYFESAEEAAAYFKQAYGGKLRGG